MRQRDFARKKWVGIRHRKKAKEIRMTSLSSDSGELQDSRNVLCRYTHMVSSFHGYHLYQFYIYRIALVRRCLSVCLSLKDSWIHLTGERKTFGLTIIRLLLIFRQHHFPPFPKDLGKLWCKPVTHIWQRLQRKGECKMFTPL